LLIATVASLQGCYVPKPVAHSLLHIGIDGSFQFEGIAVSAQDLPVRLRDARDTRGHLIVQIQAEPGASLDSIRAAVAAVSSAKARVAFTGEV
jgi:hypothetical protein